MTFTHRELCEIGAKWISNGRFHQCKSVLIEPATCDERPDVIGFRYFTPPFGSVVIEAKTSRSDFLSDKGKEHRAEGKGMGKWRYFLCPVGIIKPDETPDGWGLLYVTDKGRVKVIKGVFESTQYVDVCKNIEKYAFEVRDIESELRILGSNLQFRINNESNGLTYKELHKRYAAQLQTIRVIEDHNERLQRQVKSLEKEMNQMSANLKLRQNIAEIQKGELREMSAQFEQIKENHEY